MKAAALVAATYVYFLLFAQFAFLRGIHALGQTSGGVHTVLGTMAIAGAAGSLLAPFVIRRFGASVTLALGLIVAASAAALAGVSFDGVIETRMGLLALESALTGVGLASATVALASDLRRLTRARAIGLHVGCGTAAAYFFCNVPFIFSAAPATQCRVAAAIAAAGAIVAAAARPKAAETISDLEGSGGVAAVWFTGRGLAAAVAAFLALVWFDSAAFAAVQLDPGARTRFWGDDGTLWTNGAAHAVAAIAGGWWIDRGSLRVALAAAMVALVLGSIGFVSDGFASRLAAPIYVAGVSIYSTALAAFAALRREVPGQPPLAWRAAWLYAIAGWLGSASGVGLAEQFGMLPAWAPALAIGVLVTALVATVIIPSSEEART